GLPAVLGRVGGGNVPPAAPIWAPADGSSTPAGTLVTHTATASDDFDGDLTGQLRWLSDRDGPLGGGGTLSSLLSEGAHTLTAAVTDSDGATATAQVRFGVTATAPAVTIVEP